MVQTLLTQLCKLGCMRTKTPVWGAPEQRALGWCAPSVCLILPGGGQLLQDSAAPGQAEWPMACPPECFLQQKVGLLRGQEHPSLQPWSLGPLPEHRALLGSESGEL